MNKEGIAIANHKGTQIFYVEKGNKFVFENEDGVKFEADSLIAAKRKIGSWGTAEEREKAQPKQKGLKYIGSHNGEATVHEVIVGAFGKTRYNDVAFWYTDARGRNRQRDRVREWSPIYQDTPEARAAFEEVAAITKEIAAAKKEADAKIEKLVKKLPIVKPLIAEAELPHWER